MKPKRPAVDKNAPDSCAIIANLTEPVLLGPTYHLGLGMNVLPSPLCLGQKYRMSYHATHAQKKLTHPTLIFNRRIITISSTTKGRETLRVGEEHKAWRHL